MKCDQPIARRLNGWNRVAAGTRRPLNHDDRNRQGTRRNELGHSSVPARILGDDDVDFLPFQQCEVVLGRERPACRDDRMARQPQRYLRQIDDTDDVVVVGMGFQQSELLAADRGQHAERCRAESCDGRRDIGNAGPVIARLQLPCRAFDRNQGGSRMSASRDRIRTDLGRERMGCVDDGVDTFALDVGGQARNAAKTSRTSIEGRGLGVLRAPGIRERRVELWPFRKEAGEGVCLGGTAEQEKSGRGFGGCWHGAG